MTPTILATDHLRLSAEPGHLLLRAAGDEQAVGLPGIEVDGRWVDGPWTLASVGPAAALPHGGLEAQAQWHCGALRLHGTFRAAPAAAALRYRFQVHSTAPATLTQATGAPRLRLAQLTCGQRRQATEVRLSAFNHLLHSYVLREVPLTAAQWADRALLSGPIFTVSDAAGRTVTLAYEHGSTHPDTFAAFRLDPDGGVTLEAVRGHYLPGQPLGPAAPPLETLWLHLLLSTGGVEGAASAYRRFLLEGQAANPASRAPLIFYNTWNHQERNRYWRGHPSYHQDLHEQYLLAEIDTAHRAGVEVFVIDTGWFDRTGEWTVDPRRFPHGLTPIRHRLDAHGMRLGLWFDNAAACGHPIHTDHRDCLVSSQGRIPDPAAIWETAPAQRLCLVSRFWHAFADSLVRLHEQTGVSYFKLDAINQYGCDDPGHDHGDAAHPPQQRSDMHAFLLPLYLLKVVERVQRRVPHAIVDFDVTEKGRAVGTAFLAAGKFFLINNGPYCWDFDIPTDKAPDRNPNLFFQKGAARTWVCRATLDLDRWVPSCLLLTHYFPDEPQALQENAVASLVLGHHGIWGDLRDLSAAGVDYLGRLLGYYRQVRHDACRADPIRRGVTADSAVEVHEKISAQTGRGVVCLFAPEGGAVTYTTVRAVVPQVQYSGPAEVTWHRDGRARITITFAAHERARALFFGASA